MMINRRRFVQSTFAAAFSLAPAAAQDTSPNDPWNAGSSASQNVPESLTAEPGTVQVVRTSPVLAPEFALIVIHNNTDHAVMLQSVFGTVAAADDPATEREQYAYFIPNVILPPGEYWIGHVRVVEQIATGTPLTASWTVNLHTGTDNFNEPRVLLTTIAPAGDEPSATPAARRGRGRNSNRTPFPFTHRDDTDLIYSGHVIFSQAFFNEEGEVCGYMHFSTGYQRDGVAMVRTPIYSGPGEMPLGETTESWLAQWSVNAGQIIEQWRDR